jgi:hypothetical protein
MHILKRKNFLSKNSCKFEDLLHLLFKKRIMLSLIYLPCGFIKKNTRFEPGLNQQKIQRTRYTIFIFTAQIQF